MRNASPHIPAQIAEEIERRWFGPRMKKALLMVAEGQSYRLAAKASGLRSHQDIARAAKTIPGLQRGHVRAWRASWGKEFPEMWRHHLRDLDEVA